MTTPLTKKDSQDAATQQIAREAWAQLDRATLTHHNLDGGKSEQGISIILSAIERAFRAQATEQAQRLMALKPKDRHLFRLCTEPTDTRSFTAAQPQPSKARKEQAPRAQGSPASGEPSETANVHIEHYFPKGYDPDAEPWKSIKSHHYASLAATQAPRGQQQEWTPEIVKKLVGVQARRIDYTRIAQRIADAHNAALAVKQRYIDDIRTTTYSDLERQLADERQRREKLEKVAQAWEDDAKRYAQNSDRYRDQLLSALAAIAEIRHDVDRHDITEYQKLLRIDQHLKHDLSALHERDAEQFRKGWEAGNKAGLEVREPLVEALEWYVQGTLMTKVAKEALAKVKEQ